MYTQTSFMSRPWDDKSAPIASSTMFPHVSTLAQILGMFRESDITEGGIKGVWVYQETEQCQ
jgi:hypothetical protein